MAFSRVAALRSTLRSTRSSTLSKPQLWRQAARRGYASGGHAKPASGDAVWAAGAVAVTAPTCWYLLQNGPAGHHDDPHHDTDNSHHGVKEKDTSENDDEDSNEGKDPKGGEDAEAKSEDEEKTEEKTEDKEEKSEESEKSEKSEDKKEESDKKDDEEKDDQKDSDKSDEKDSDDLPKADSKGPDSHSVGETDQNRVKSIPDAKGGSKKRLESKSAITQGGVDDEDNGEDKGASSKQAGSMRTQSGKQEGLSSTDTKHSTDIVGNADKSTKGEGGPETAKLKGTVQVDRPAK